LLSTETRGTIMLTRQGNSSDLEEDLVMLVMA